MSITKITKKVLADGLISDITSEISTPIISRIEKSEQKNLEQELRLNYLEQRQQFGSEFYVENFFDTNQTSKTESVSSKLAEVMDDTDWNNNWKKREGSPEFKNGFLRPRKQKYMLENMDEFQLEGIGQLYKCAISQYDSINQCYWFISNAGENGIGEITKLSKHMSKGKVEVIGRWYIPIPGAAGRYWSGIEVDSTGTKLWFNYWANASSKIYGVVINTDGSLGATGYTKRSGEQIDLTNSVYASFTDSTASSTVNDIIDWSSTEIAYLLNATTTVSLKFLLKSNLTTGTSTTITGFGNYVGGSTNGARTTTKYGNDLYIRMNDPTDDKRFIYKFNIISDIVSNAVIKSSGRFENTRYIDEEGQAWGGVTIGSHGDLLEIVSTASNGKFLTRRALVNALWSENQVNEEYKCNSSTLPNQPVACMVEDNRYYWTGDHLVTANEVDIFRFDTQTGSYKHARLTNVGWTYLRDLTYNPTTDKLYLLGMDGTYFECILGDLSDFVALMGNSYNVSNTIALNTASGGTWGLYAGGLGSNATTNNLYGICYDSDNDILYLPNSTTLKIDTLSIDGATRTQGVYDLPAAVSNWQGIAYKNGNIFLGDYTGTTQPNRIYVLPVNRQSSAVWYRKHVYQDPSTSFVVNGRACIDFCNNDIVNTNYTTVNFTKMKVLEDPDVLQLHTFIDSNNVLLSDNVQYATPVSERYFDPEEFSDIRDCPDKNYMGIGYGNEGVTILHLDDFLSGKSSTGKDRYDVTTIRKWDFKRASNNIIPSSSFATSAMSIEKDLIFIGTTTNTYSTLIDLKAGKVYVLYSTTGSGYYYNGTITERNDAKGFTGTYISDLDISSYVVRKTHARTFTKEDESDYKGENPVTFIVIGTDGGSDLLRIDWDSNNNRTPVRVWNNVFSATTIRYGLWISNDGKLFGGDNGVSGGIYVIAAGANPGLGAVLFNPYVWEINYDAAGHQYLCGTSSLLGGYITDISPNSRCWKTPSGTWRHQLLCSTGSSGGSGYFRIGIVDVENSTLEIIYGGTGATYTFFTVDTSEDMVFYGLTYNSTNTHPMSMVKKLRFTDKFSPTAVFNCWYFPDNNNIMRDTRPRFCNYSYNVSGLNNLYRYSNRGSFLIEGTTISGIQLYHFQQNNLCTHESLEFDIDETYSNVFYIQNAIKKGALLTSED